MQGPTDPLGVLSNRPMTMRVGVEVNGRTVFKVLPIDEIERWAAEMHRKHRIGRPGALAHGMPPDTERLAILVFLGARNGFSMVKRGPGQAEEITDHVLLAVRPQNPSGARGPVLAAVIAAMTTLCRTPETKARQVVLELLAASDVIVSDDAIRDLVKPRPLPIPERKKRLHGKTRQKTRQ